MALNLNKLKLESVDVAGKRVFIRVDFNVPQDKADPTIITNTARIEGALPSIKYCLEKGAKSVVLASHLGRPDGKKVDKFTLAPVAKALEKLISKPVTFLPDCCGEEVEAACADPAPGSVILLENVRFHLEEEGKGVDADGEKVKAEKDKVAAFRASLCKLADVYCCDAFGTAHRAHSSMVGEGFAVKCAGFLVKKELEAFSMVLGAPKRPLVGIIGGAKVKDKIIVLEALLEKVDKLIVGGGMAYSFLKVMEDMKIGGSIYDKSAPEVVPRIVEKAKANNVEIILPVDFICGNKFSEESEVKGPVSKAEGIPDGWEGFDCGPESNKLNAETIKGASTVIWNGPLGVFEISHFQGGTKAAMDAMVEATKAGVTTVIGGGDTATAAKTWECEDKVTFVSTGGGASLELLEGKVLPGVAALDDA